MTSFAIGFAIVIIFLAVSAHTLFNALTDGSGWLKIALSGGGFIIFLILFTASAWHIYKISFDKIN